MSTCQLFDSAVGVMTLHSGLLGVIASDDLISYICAISNHFAAAQFCIICFGFIVKLPNKGELSNSNNWRGIMLLPVTNTVLIRVLLIQDLTDPLLREELAGLRKGRS